MKRAILLGAIASLLWSTVFVFGRYLCDVLGTHPILIAFLRFFCAGIISVLYIVLRGEARSLSLLVERPATIGFLAITGIFGMGSAVFLALDRSTSVDVSIIMNSNAIFIIPLAVLVGEHLTLRKAAGVIIGLLGCALVINGKITGFQLVHREHFIGNLIALVAAICWAVYTVVGKRLVRERGGLVVTSLNMIVGSVPLFFLLVGLGELTLPPIRAFLIILYLAIFPTALGFVFWYKALESLDASRLGPLQYLVPIGTAAIAFFVLDESLRLASMIGMVLVFLGIYLSTISAADTMITPAKDLQT
jgi:drug/metabolite transporter (DMT)-like permease